MSEDRDEEKAPFGLLRQRYTPHRSTATQLIPEGTPGRGRIVTRVAKALCQESLKAGVKDALTGLADRKGFAERLDHEILSAYRTGRSLSVLEIELDHFKSVNDTLGHSAGDEVLKNLGKVVSGVIRETDLLARKGGDEFYLILPETGQEGFEQAVERIRQAIEVGLPTTASLGGTILKTGTHFNGTREKLSLEDRQKISRRLVTEADVAVYQAKHGGRNKFVLFKEGMEMPGR